ncbi:11842_t:CDS:2 [Acaulospora morrowiae]|uniref:Folic acid synthesis protein FOL1 n=1 Tax=Acaulospora morrowiae TaxID=94023 RepID=A0A9N9G8Q4_9GLOM|nr:11842_t:CDS:2 [Acaulospora morrowiae]
MEKEPNDKIILKNLALRSIVGVDAWERVKCQPIVVNITAEKSISKAGETDELSHTTSYSDMNKAITKFVEESTHESIEILADGISKICLSKFNVQKVTVRVEKPRVLLHAASAGVEITRTEEYIEAVSANDSQDIIFVKDLKLSTIIGINPWERETKQIVILNLTIYTDFRNAGSQRDFRTIVKKISEHVEESSYKTVEAISTSITRIAITQCDVEKITVRVEKPSALTFVESAGIEITRNYSYFAKTILDLPDGYEHFAFIGLGSNMGDRCANINEALRQIEESCNCKILDTSFLYETSPMYITDQPKFLNATCKVATKISPEELLKKLKEIEFLMGRIKVIKNGPRLVDLDILFYDDLEYNSEILTIPHPLICEREFVLRPLCDIASKFKHPKNLNTCDQLLSQYLKSPNHDSKNTVKKILPIHSSQWILNSRTYIMGILNVTPDSFSDGGLFNSVESAVAHAEKLALEGADIIDIGGMSTRPNADDISVEEEIARVIPIIKAIRAKGITDTPISIDTFRSVIAEKAVEAGANIINDISGGKLDPDMYRVMAKANVPVCLQHMRGDSKTMADLSNYDDLISDICTELLERVRKAIKAGVKRWNIIIDPGIGFSKNFAQNFQILRRCHELVGEGSPLEGFPCLIGPSRKGFIGNATGQPDAKKRGWGTAAACSAAIAGGVDVLRVHDVKEIIDVAKVSDCIWRDRNN